jgi:hypothetical protein
MALRWSLSARPFFSGLLFLLSAWLTRAGYWRTAAALLGGLVAAAGLRFGLDMVAYRFDWWTLRRRRPTPRSITYAPVPCSGSAPGWD